MHRSEAHEEAPQAAAPAERAPGAPTTLASTALRLQATAGNAAVGRLLARQPTTDEVTDFDVSTDPFGRTKEEIEADVREMHEGLAAKRQEILDSLNFQRMHRFLPLLRGLDAWERGQLEKDQEFWRGVRKHLSGFSLWSVQKILEYGQTAPHDVNALSAAVFGKEASRIHELLMAYPSLKKVPGLREVLSHQFSGQELTSLLARLDEGDGERHESGETKWQEAHYEKGEMHRFTGTRNYELVRTPSQLRVIVRIRLNADPDKPGGITNEATDRWRTGIRSVWNNRFRVRSGTTRLDVWFLPVFVYWDPKAHHNVKASPGDERSDEHHWHEEDSAGTAAHEFGHMIGNPDEYNLPARTSEIPASMKLTDEERRRSSYEGITGDTTESKTTEGIDMSNVMGAHHKSTAVKDRHGWDVLRVLNDSSLRHAGEDPFVLELK